MLKIFLIQPMRGKGIEEILEERRRVVDSLESKEDFEIINNVYDSPTENVKYDSVWYLGKSLEVLAKADLVLLYPGWENYDGCVVEFQCASRNKIPMKQLLTQKETEIIKRNKRDKKGLFQRLKEFFKL